MSTINEKLLLECIDAILAGDMKTAERKFNNNWDRTSQKIIEALDMEDAEDDIEIADTVEDVMNDESDAEEDCFDDILAAVSELETKFPTEMTDEIQAHFDELSIEDMLNSVEGKYNIIRNEFLQGGRVKGDPADGIFELIEELQKSPNIGPSLEGKIFSSACRGARQGCFYLKSASSGSGKTRTAVFDACHLAYPIRWSHEYQTFIKELDYNGQPRDPYRVLFIVTEMDKQELQTIMLAYVSGVDESHILTGKYELGELERVKCAARLIQNYSGYFYIEEISDPNLVNVEATIKKYATIENIKYVFNPKRARRTV